MISLSQEKFEQLVDQGIAAIPRRFLHKLDNVGIVIADEPSPQQRSKQRLRAGDLLLGLYEGIPRTERWGYNLVLPDKITIFKKPIEQISDSEAEVAHHVRITVWHEIAHHFGMNEGRVRAAETRRRAKKS